MSSWIVAKGSYIDPIYNIEITMKLTLFLALLTIAAGFKLSAMKSNIAKFGIVVASTIPVVAHADNNLLLEKKAKFGIGAGIHKVDSVSLDAKKAKFRLICLSLFVPITSLTSHIKYSEVKYIIALV